MFIAGIGPGLVILVMFCAWCWLATLRFGIAPLPRASWTERRDSLRKSLLPLGFPIIIIGGIYTGVFSPTEAAAVSVLYAAALEVLVFREMRLSDLPGVALSTGLVTSVVFVLVAAGAAFSWVISFAQLPSELIGGLGLTADTPPWLILAVISVSYFIGCMFVDPIVVILILTPIFHPVAVAAGIDPVLVGVVVTLQVAIGSATPPFGCDIFTAIAIFRRPYLEVIRGTPPFIAILLVSAALVIWQPQIALFLRDLAFGR
jgi:tripartite ATP-independent transporter DctM subunit